MNRAGLGSCAKNDARDVDYVRRQRAATDWILSDEFQQARIVEVVVTFERDALKDEPGILAEKLRETAGVARVNEVDGAAEQRIFDSLVVGNSGVVGRQRFLDATFDASLNLGYGPARIRAYQYVKRAYNTHRKFTPIETYDARFASYN